MIEIGSKTAEKNSAQTNRQTNRQDNTKTRHRASTIKHVLANIFRSLFVARTPSEEDRSPGRRTNVENVPRQRPITGEPATPTSHIRRAILRTPPVTRQSAASSANRPRPVGRSCYVAIATQPVPRLQIRPIMHNYRGQPLPCPKLHPGPCSCVGVRPRTDRHTDTHTDELDHNTFCVVYDSRKNVTTLFTQQCVSTVIPTSK